MARAGERAWFLHHSSCFLRSRLAVTCHHVLASLLQLSWLQAFNSDPCDGPRLPPSIPHFSLSIPSAASARAAVCKRHSGNWSFHERSKYLSVSVATCITRPENYLKSWSPHSSSPGSFIFKDRVCVCLCVRVNRMVWQVLRLGGSSLIHFRE